MKKTLKILKISPEQIHLIPFNSKGFSQVLTDTTLKDF